MIFNLTETASTNEITSNDKDVKILAGSIEGLEQIMNNQVSKKLK